VPRLTRTATARSTKYSGHRQLLTKPQGVLHRTATKVKLHPTRVEKHISNACNLVGDGSAIPFNTQFFHDDYDDGPGFDDGFDGDLAGTADPGEQDLLAGTQGKTRRVRPEFVNYTKRAKRVDVRKLKENIWKGLKIPTPEQHPDDAEIMVRDVHGIRTHRT
jgi:Condensin complex subunit 2